MTQQAYTGHSGPYIVTKLVPLSPPEAGHDVSRRAVATLEEARSLAAVKVGELDDSEQTNAVCDWPMAYRAAREMPASGARLSNFPDGTVIEVEKTTYVHLACDSDWKWPENDTDYSSPARHSTEVLAAYNAKQESARV
jgi:hypothetical protein